MFDNGIVRRLDRRGHDGLVNQFRAPQPVQYTVQHGHAAQIHQDLAGEARAAHARLYDGDDFQFHFRFSKYMVSTFEEFKYGTRCSRTSSRSAKRSR